MDATKARLREAVEFYNTKKHASVRAVAKEYNVSRSTLQRAINQAALTNSIEADGHKWYRRLDPSQEECLIQWIDAQSSQGHPPTRRAITKRAERILQEAGDPQPLGKHYIFRLTQRRDELKSVYYTARKRTKAHQDSNERFVNRKNVLEGIQHVAKRDEGSRPTKRIKDGSNTITQQTLDELEALDLGYLKDLLEWKME